LAKLLNDYPGLSAAVPIRDKPSVEKCRRAAVGDVVELSIGGRYSKETPPVCVAAEVIAFDENVDAVLKGPAHGGVRIPTGPYAVVKVGKVHIALTERPLTYLDPNFYEAMGIRTRELRVIVARSGYHYTLNYADVGDCITCDTVGMTSYRLAELPFTVARPFFPVDRIAYQPVTAIRTRDVQRFACSGP
jgi:microcystin degradation protein MlrC